MLANKRRKTTPVWRRILLRVWPKKLLRMLFKWDTGQSKNWEGPCFSIRSRIINWCCWARSLTLALATNVPRIIWIKQIHCNSCKHMVGNSSLTKLFLQLVNEEMNNVKDQYRLEHIVEFQPWTTWVIHGKDDYGYKRCLRNCLGNHDPALNDCCP